MKKYFYLFAFAFLLTANAFSQVNVLGALGTGVNTTYTTLSSACTAITSVSQTNANIKIEISGNTTEPSTAILTNKGWASLKIYPTSNNNWTISGTITAGPIIHLNGAQKVTIDGSVNGTGNTKSLTITNTSNSSNSNTSTIRLGGDAKDNTLQYCTIKGSSMASVGGIIYFSAPSTSSNTGNVIANNNITSDAAGHPLNAIFSSGTSGKLNTTGNTISYNNIYDFFNASNGSTGIYLKDYCDNFTIQGNNFYETTNFTPTATLNYNVISTGSSVSSCIIKDNYIGGNAPGCSGTWTKSGATFGGNFTAIACANPTGTTTYTIQNNVIKGFDFTNNSGTTTLHSWTGISLNGTGDVTCQDNTISSVITKETAGTAAYFITGIIKTATTGTVTIKNNAIGSLSNSKDMNASSASTNTNANANVYGISYNGTATSGTSYIGDNTIANLNSGSINTSGSGTLGIFINSATTHSLSINRNFIYGLSESGNARLFGLRCYATPSTACNVINNIISLSPIDNSLIQGGIYHDAANAANYYHNIVFIGGSGNGESVALLNAVPSGSTFKNNLFVNIRTNNDATNHLAYRSTLTTTNTLDFNDFYVDSSNGFMLASIGSTPPYTAKAIGGFGDTHSLSINPSFSSPGAAAVSYLLSPDVTLTGASGTGIATDFDGAPRPASPRIGAYESSYASGNVSALSDNASVTVLNGNTLTVDASKTLYNVTVQGGGKLTNIAGGTLTVTNFKINSDATNGNGTYVENNSGSTLNVTGTTTVNQYLTAGRNWYISSPLTAASSTMFNSAAALNINKLYWYDETQGSSTTLNWPQIKDNSTSLIVTKGYVANVDASLLAATKGVTFSGGLLNSGTITKGLNGVPALTFTSDQAFAGYNLVGNPYPSYLNAMAAINNTNATAGTTVINPTIWYRTQSTGAAPTYYFETVNTTSGEGTNAAGTGTVTGYVPPMQAFWLQTYVNGQQLTFDNVMRAHSINVPFGETTVPTTPLKAKSQSDTQRLRLQVSNGTHSDETVIYTHPNATNGYDIYDSSKRSNANVAIPEIYTTSGTEQLAINGLNSVTPNLEIPLGFTPGAMNNFSIKASEVSNFAQGMRIFLIDNLTNTLQDLTDGTAYLFSSDATATVNRFSVIFRTSSGTTSINNNIDSNNSIFAFKNANNQIVVNISSEIVGNASVSVYNAVGQKLESKQLTNVVSVLDNSYSSGIYLVSVISNGKKTTCKVVIN